MTSPEIIPAQRQKIAVIGSGIAGMSAAWGLSKAHDVILFEKASYIGGHANTVDVKLKGEDDREQAIPVDTGFIVYNETNYPNLVAMFKALGVVTAPSDMSFGVSLNARTCEYSGQSVRSVFATPSNLVSPKFWKFLLEIPKFHKVARRALKVGIDDSLTLGDFIDQHTLSKTFTEEFMIPMAGAIWSAPSDQILAYPANAMLRFFQNHGLLRVLNMPIWRTVQNGSREYVEKVLHDFVGNIRLNCAVESVVRQSDKVLITFTGGEKEIYDQVVIATHGDTAHDLLKNPSEREKSILSAFQYMRNKAYLHCDPRHMPRKKVAWSAWNVLRDKNQVALTYWMNKLQPLPCKDNIFVTLNPIGDIDKVLGTYNYDHPLYTHRSCQAQEEIWSIQGLGNVWYAGAHLGSGFHEDGLQAGLAVAEAIGGFRRPWSVENPSARLSITHEFKKRYFSTMR